MTSPVNPVAAFDRATIQLLEGRDCPEDVRNSIRQLRVLFLDQLLGTPRSSARPA